jgi:DNA polymerase|nr:MAG TPA: DNA polymerase I [Caudoviricetes sp.]
MRTLSIDIETYSSVSLTESGVYAYSEAPDFTILLLAYGFDDEEVQVIDLAQGEDVPCVLLEALISDDVIKTAYNANFERTCLARYLGKSMPPNQWRCTAVHASMLGLPGNLKGVCEALGLGEEEIKSKTGRALIQYFSIPCKPNAKNGQRTRNLPAHDLEKWQLFKDYCKQDVVAERAIKERLSIFPVPQSEQELWELDQKINDGGILIDTQLVDNIIGYDQIYQEKLMEEAKALTGLTNPNSVAQLKNWLRDQGINPTGLTKAKVEELLETTTEDVNRVLQLRKAMSKTSTKKFEAMKRALCQDNRVRGTLQFYGANRSGRWAGRLLQVHNLPQNKVPDIELARELVKEGDFETLEMLFGETPFIFSQLVRTAIVAQHNFIISDFSAIEARVVAWLANEQWVLETFQGDGKLYEHTASRMFNVPIEKIVKGQPEYELRQKGKLATLACGYGGSVGALTSMGALKMGLVEEELSDIVRAWRQANPNIVRLWYDTEKAVKDALDTGWQVAIAKGVSAELEQGTLFIALPSGRRLAYAEVALEDNEITYMGIDQQSKKWTKLRTYGAKLVENITQAIARDCLAEAMKRLDQAGYSIVIHVHDEVVIDTDKDAMADITEMMSRDIDWVPGLPLRGDTYQTKFYKKD